MKILVKEDHRAPVVVSQVWYKVGSSYEPGGITGISHMLEHMMFKGTQQYPAGEFSRIIAEQGGQENAFTGNDYTAYFQTLEKSRLEISFKLEADRMRNLDLKAEELEKELQVVTEERRMRTEDKPRAKMQEQFNAVAFANSPYKNPVIGWPSDIANYKVEDLQAWYQQWYAPNNATMVVVGDVDAGQVVKLAEQYFAGLKPSEIKPLKPQAEIEQKGIRKLTVKAPAKLPYLMMGYKVPVLNTAKPEWEAYALEVLAGILDGGNGARLSTRLVRGKEIAVSAGTGYDMTSRLPDMFLLEATPAEGKNVFDLEYALKEEVYQLQNELVSQDELQRIKAQVLANDIYQKDSNFYQAMQLGLLETVGIGWQKADAYVSNINKVTAEQVREVARKYLIDDSLTVAYLDPQPITEAPKTGKSIGGRHAF
jgi:zinc protease